MSRSPLDFYATPPHYIAALFGEVNLWGKVIEPCCGDGAIVEALRTRTAIRKVVANDIDTGYDADLHFDARLPWPGHYDWAVTNPPFCDELPILEQAFDAADNVAFLARLSFLEPTEDREYLLESRRPTQIIVLPRYSFRPNDQGKRATDSMTCCWLVWHADREQRGLSVWGRPRSMAYAVMEGLAA